MKRSKPVKASKQSEGAKTVRSVDSQYTANDFSSSDSHYDMSGLCCLNMFECV